RATMARALAGFSPGMGSASPGRAALRSAQTDPGPDQDGAPARRRQTGVTLSRSRGGAMRKNARRGGTVLLLMTAAILAAAPAAAGDLAARARKLQAEAIVVDTHEDVPDA